VCPLTGKQNKKVFDKLADEIIPQYQWYRGMILSAVETFPGKEKQMN